MRAAAVALLVAAVGCGLSITTPDLDMEGVVTFVDVEGGCWGIATDGEIYEPIDLPESMRTDGLVVLFEAVELTDRASVCQIGPVIDLLRITTMPD